MSWKVAILYAIVAVHILFTKLGRVLIVDLRIWNRIIDCCLHSLIVWVLVDAVLDHCDIWIWYWFEAELFWIKESWLCVHLLLLVAPAWWASVLFWAFQRLRCFKDAVIFGTILLFDSWSRSRWVIRYLLLAGLNLKWCATWALFADRVLMLYVFHPLYWIHDISHLAQLIQGLIPQHFWTVLRQHRTFDSSLEVWLW